MSDPRKWARLAVALGILLLLPAAVTLPSVAGPPRAGLSGPLNILLAGIDPRGTHTRPLSDTIIVAHIPADRRGVYLFSLPRDLVVWIPPFAKNGVTGRYAKINAAMALGSETGPDRYDPGQGWELLATTVGQVTGIKRFDAGAVINFGGFKRMVQTLGGVEMTVDQDVVSEHLKPDGTRRDLLPGCRIGGKCLRPYTGPQKIYPKSTAAVRLRPWEALDFVRQRYGLPRSDYDRQRHQRQFLRAVARQITDPAQLLKVMATVGDDLTFKDGGHDLTDWLVALKDVDTTAVVTVTLPGGPVLEHGKYLGERFGAGVTSFFAAVKRDRVAAYLLDHPTLVDPVVKTRRPSSRPVTRG
ncbi:LCP family protein [Actinoplanes sp. NPDC026670]|uniref:LCP family protein n=1 Tax=Actinoplanes sp. NPDC026670 TaxID=3154700 RepID=UPI0033C2E693